MLRVTSPESGGPISVCSALWLSIEGVCKRLALATVILLALVLGIALLRLVVWLLTPERDKDKSERDYWRMHGE